MALIDAGLRILRQRLWLIHPSPENRTVVNEYTLVNDTSDDIKDVLLVDLPLMVGLEAFNEDENRLPFLPNTEVRRIVTPLIDKLEKEQPKSEDEIKKKSESLQKLESMTKHGPPYYLWIRLPEDEKICPGDSKIIRLKYREKAEPRVPSISVTPFSVERHRVVFHKPPNQNYDIFVNISGPSGYELEANSIAIFDNLKILDEKDGFYQTHLDDFEQVRIPNTQKDGIGCLIIYDIFPPESEQKFFKGTIIGLYILTSFLVFLAIMAKLSPEAYDKINENFYYSIFGIFTIPDILTAFSGVLGKMFEITGGIVALSVAIAGFVKDPLFGRARWLYLGTAALAIIAFLIKQ